MSSNFNVNLFSQFMLKKYHYPQNIYMIIFLTSLHFFCAGKDLRVGKPCGQAKLSAEYIHPESPSFQSKYLQWGMGFLGMKTGLDDAMKNKKFRKKPESPSSSFRKTYVFQEINHSGRIIYNLVPKSKSSDTVIFYLHGGAYINNIRTYQWDMMESIADKTGARIFIPDYPLAPESTFESTYAFIESSYNLLLKETTPDKIIFYGDSAGGGLALGLAQKLKKEKKNLPSQIILMAPWLDITMTNPDIKEIDPRDRLLSTTGLVEAGKAYAGTTDPKNPLISPIYGEFKELGKISVFIGTNDLLYADVLKLKRIFKEQNLPLQTFEYPGMFHVWPVIRDMKESEVATTQISELILGCR